jgi:hypothetical protein
VDGQQVTGHGYSGFIGGLTSAGTHAFHNCNTTRPPHGTKLYFIMAAPSIGYA